MHGRLSRHAQLSWEEDIERCATCTVRCAVSTYKGAHLWCQIRTLATMRPADTRGVTVLSRIFRTVGCCLSYAHRQLTSGQDTWSARCGVIRTPGAAGGPGKPALRS